MHKEQGQNVLMWMYYTEMVIIKDRAPILYPQEGSVALSLSVESNSKAQRPSEAHQS